MTADVDISQEYLKSILLYDAETGVFIWKSGPCRGKVAGCIRRDGYVLIRLNGKLRYAHRLAFIYVTGSCPRFVDHADGYPSNNAFVNLRGASQSQNGGNSTSPWRALPKGVSRVRTGKYVAQICPDRVRIHLGTFDTPEEAEVVYKAAADKVWGSFAAHNREESHYGC